MVQRNWWVKVALGMCLAGTAVAVHATGPARSLIVQLRPSAAEGTLISTSARMAREARLQRLATAAGYPSAMPWRSLGGRMTSLRVPTPLSPAKSRELAARLMATGQVEWVEPNVRQKRLAYPVPTDPHYTRTPLDLSQWWLKETTSGNAMAKPLRQRGAPGISTAWASGATGESSGIVVAVLDTGHLPHPDLPAERILPGRDFVDDLNFSGDGDGRDADPTDPGDWVSAAESRMPVFRSLGCEQEDSSWHGMVITGLIAARADTQGVAGISGGVRILPVRVAGKCGADVEDIVAGIRWAAGESVDGQTNPNPARVINISFGGDGACGPAYLAAVQEAKARGAVVVAAAGNEHRAVSRPASCDGVIGVAALNREGFKSTYSNFGPQIAVSTVGGDFGPEAGNDGGDWGALLGDTGILTVANRGTTTPGTYDYAYHAGTSFSAPVVAGVISLMLDVNPALTPDQIRQGLQVSARPHVTSSRMGQCSSSNPGRCLCTTSTCGAGILDALEAVRYAGNPMGYSRTSNIAENIDSAEVIQAVNAYPQDRAANTASGNSGGSSNGDSGGGGGGGGAADATLVGGLGVLLGALVLGRLRGPRRLSVPRR